MAPFQIEKINAFWWGPLSLAAFLFGATFPLFAAEQKVDVDLLRHKAQISIQRMPEFANISIEASRRGLRVWALGGAASSLVDHAKHELLGPNYSPRLEWNFNNVLLPEQDVDLVVTRANGSAETAKEVEDFLAWVRQQYPYTADGRSRWEAMGLTTSSQNGRKMAVGADPDFLRQHNDSLSLGMVEITLPPPGEQPFRNLGNKTDFVRDIAESEFHFLYNPTHAQTARFRSGLNPPILSVIRALEKATRYNLNLSSESVRVMKQIVAQWDPSSVAVDSYVYNYLHGRGKRVLTHAHDLEEALKLVDSLGLKNKFLQLPGANPATPESLGWWLLRSPLPKKASAGSFTGHTAGSLGIHRAYHWTSHANHRLMTWNYDAYPRLFESRQGVAGEAAVLGNGFYTFANDPSNIRHRAVRTQDQFVEFAVNPTAKEGIDFTYDRATETVVWKSSEHLKVAPQKFVYPHNLSCSSAYASVGGLANQPFSAANSAQMLAAARAQAAARTQAAARPAPPSLATILFRGQWKDIPDWIGRNPMETLLGGVFAFYFATKGSGTPDEAPPPSPTGPEGRKSDGPPKRIEASKEDFAKNSVCLKTLAEGPGPECGAELSGWGKNMAKLLASSGSAKVDQKSIDWLRGINDQSHTACVQKLAALDPSPDYFLSDFLTQCEGRAQEPDLSLEAQKFWKDKSLAVTPLEFRHLARIDHRSAQRCIEALPAGINPLEGSRLEDCANLPPEAFAQLTPFLVSVQKALGVVPLSLSKEMIEMGPESAPCFAALGALTKDSRRAVESCTREKPSPELLAILQAVVANSGKKDWSKDAGSINEFLRAYKSPASMECLKIFTGELNQSPMNKEAIALCSLPQIAKINGFLAKTLKHYAKNNWSTSSLADRLRPYGSDLSSICGNAVAETGFDPTHARIAPACGAVVEAENINLLQAALPLFEKNRWSLENISLITQPRTPAERFCRESMMNAGYNPTGDVTNYFCAQAETAEMNKLLPDLIKQSREDNFYLGQEAATQLKLYTSDLSRECGKILAETGWKISSSHGAKACAEVADKENLPLLKKSLAFLQKNNFSGERMYLLTKMKTSAERFCREAMVDAGYNPTGDTANAFCLPAEVAEMNKLLPDLIKQSQADKWSLLRDHAGYLAMYKSDLSRECAQVAIKTNWRLTHPRLAAACSELRNAENLPVLEKALTYLNRKSMSAENIAFITQITSPAERACRSLLMAADYNPIGDTAHSFCAQAETAEMNKLLPDFIKQSQEGNWSLSSNSVGYLKLYRTDISRECARALAKANWRISHPHGASACGEMTNRENFPLLEKALVYLSKNNLSGEKIYLLTQMKSPAERFCREAMMNAGYNPTGDVTNYFCAQAETAEMNKLLPDFIQQSREGGWGLNADAAAYLKLYRSDLSRECARTAIRTNWRLTHSKLAYACSEMTNGENLPLLEKILAFLSRKNWSADNVGVINKITNQAERHCRQLLTTAEISPIGDIANAFCSQAETPEMNKILGDLLPLYAKKNWSLSSSDVGKVMQYKTDRARHCAKALIEKEESPLSQANLQKCTSSP